MLYTKDNFYLLKIKHYTDFKQYTLSRIFKRNSTSKKKHSKKEEISRCSISRSIATIKDYILCNKFDYFVTITLKDFSFRCDTKKSIDFFINKISNYAQNSKNHGLDFKYLFVFEKQHKGRHTFARLF